MITRRSPAPDASPQLNKREPNPAHDTEKNFLTNKENTAAPAVQIGDIHNCDSDRKKALLFDRVNYAKVRIATGGAGKLAPA